MSSHLFNDIQAYRVLGLVLIAAAMVYSLWRFWKVRLLREPVRRLSAIVRLTFVPIFAISLYVYVILPQTKQLQRLKDFGVETRGITEGTIRIGKSTEVLFEFEINGTRFQNKMNRKNGAWKYFDNVRESGGVYVVIYDPANPKNALMDFNRPLPD